MIQEFLLFLSKINRSTKGSFIPYSFIQAFNALAPIIILPYLIAQLGLKGYGYIAITLSLTIIINLVIDYGFNTTSTKKISQTEDIQLISYEFCSVFLTKFLVTCFIVPLALLLLIYLNTEIFEFFICNLGMILSSTLASNFVFYGMQRVKIIALITFISKLFLILTTFFFVGSGDEKVFLLLNSASFLFTSLSLLLYLFMNLKIKLTKVGSKKIYELFIEGKDIFISNLSITMYTSAIPFLMSFVLSVKEIGIFSAFEKISQGLRVMYTPVSQTLFPYFSKIFNINSLDALREIRYLIIIFSTLFGVGYLFLFFISEYVISFLSLSHIENSLIYYLLFCLAPLLAAISNIIGNLYLIPNNYESLYMKNIIVGAITSLLLYYVLSSYFYLQGAVTAFFVTELIILFLMYVTFKVKSPK